MQMREGRRGKYVVQGRAGARRKAGQMREARPVICARKSREVSRGTAG
jgi:hypothetical protein